jgi:hypothetical protein
MRARVVVYWAYLGALGAVSLSALGLVAAALLSHETIGGVIQITAGVEVLIVGVCLATNWRNSARRLRAKQRLDRRGNGELFAWFCRDTQLWWRVNGLVMTSVGLSLIALGLFTVQRYHT